MTDQTLQELLRDGTRRRLVRFLLASSGVDRRFLTEEEAAAAVELAEKRIVKVEGSDRLVLDPGGATSIKALEASLELTGRAEEDADAAAEVERLRSENQQTSTLLTFIQDLTSNIIRSASIAELFSCAFQKLSETVPCDVALSLMLEQNLEAYVSKRENYLEPIADRFITRVHEALQTQIPVSFTSTDIMIQGDSPDLPAGDMGPDPLACQAITILRQDNRTAGILAIYRGFPEFSPQEQRILELLSAQVSMVLGNIRAHEKIQNLADTDDLTGIWNKRYFRRQLPSEVERSRIYSIPLSLLIFDVDNFKGINDTFGHPMGDVVLSELCGTVRETLRPPDVFARFGGDEFSIILPHTDLMGARAVAERILQRVRGLSILAGENDESLKCSISLGIATYAPFDSSAADLLRRADEALYRSKREGKNRYTW